ncbi:MAG: patatin-like phospholipase family protein [Pseudomonadota bacterium]
MASRIASLATVGLTILVAACSNPERLPAVPVDGTTEAVVHGMRHIRFWVGADASPWIDEGLQATAREEEYLAENGHTGPLPTANFLAISGGGDNGAFGAGLLVGWSETGTRPQFKTVTGISTGALTAPFAFLGPAYDDELAAVYTQIAPDDVYTFRGPFAAIFDDAMADSAPLRKLIARYADEAMLAELAAEYHKGRNLLIATTNLDARRPVIWNVTAIAASGHPKALEIFHDILIASASLPGAFPPVMFDVEFDGKLYQEMHVDGGAMAQVFVYPGSLEVAKLSAQLGMERDRALYIIRNARLDSEWASIERQTIDIVSRAVTTLVQTQGIGDLYRIFLIAKRDHVDFNLAYIGSDFTEVHEEEFDPVFMRNLFQYGYEEALKGYEWKKFPPGYVE